MAVKRTVKRRTPTPPDNAPRRVVRRRRTDKDGNPVSKPTMDRQSRTGRLRAVQVGAGLPPVTGIMEEILDMTDVLLGREEPPIDAGFLTLMEVADAYFARASELTMLIQEGERTGTVIKGSGHYKIRTGELRTFLEMAKRAADLGSRRLTKEQLQWEMEQFGHESKGY